MKHLIKEAPGVAQGFFDLAKSVNQYSPLDKKTNELIIIGIFAAHRGITGIGTHVQRAIDEGATKEEIIAAILLALPIVGITDVNLAMEKAVESMEMKFAAQKETVGAAIN